MHYRGIKFFYYRECDFFTFAQAYYQARPSYFDRRDQGGGGGGGIGGGRWDNQVLPSAAELMLVI